jgi:hypothetical protein
MGSSGAPPRFYLVLFALFLVLVPFYLFGKTPVPQTLSSLAANRAELSEKVEGGVPQPADYVIAALLLALLAGPGYGMLPAHLPAVRAFACFVAYVALVNLAWGVLTLNLSIVQYSVYYVYGVLVFLAFLVLYARFREQLLRVTFHGVAASLLLQAVLSPLAPERLGFRRMVFFNNPNQLGYFTVVGACLFYLGTRHVRMKGWYQACVYGAGGYLALLSLSKTAFLSLTVLAVLVLLERPLVLLLGPPLLGFLLAAALYVPRDIAPSILRNLQDRLTRQEVDETIAGRGYDRFLSHPEYIFFGAGEGDYQRFRSELISELHSSYGTLLFCYGVVGTALFTWGVILVCRRTDVMSALCLAPVFTFGLAHHGLRANLFWVLLASLYCAGRAGGGAGTVRGRAVPRVTPTCRQVSTARPL